MKSIFDKFAKKGKTFIKSMMSHKLSKSLVYDALDIPFDGSDVNYSCMRFAGESVEGCVAIVREPFADRNYHSSRQTCERLAEIAVERGARLLLCEYELDGYDIVKVEDAFDAWIRITAKYRSLYKPKTVCVTGSIGKTSTVAMTKSVFNSGFRTFCNTGNTKSPNYSSRNAQQLTADIQAYIQEVVEAPFGCPGDISTMVQPQAAIITMIGSSHLDSLGSQKAILESCLTIQRGMPKDGLLILNGDDPLQWNAKLERRAVYYAINNPKADYRAQNIREEDGKLFFDIAYGEKTLPVILYCYGKHNVCNATAVFAASKWAGLSDEQIVRGLADFRPYGIRQNMIDHGGYRLFLDCYDASPESMQSALATFQTIYPKAGGKHIAVLGDIKESGQQVEEFHREVGLLCGVSNVDTLICFGKSAHLIAEGARENGVSDVYEAEDDEELDMLLREKITRNDVVLFKGSRAIRLERHVDN
ncbi:MAG: UDP-N-acetylmuramoyl-tripeptide--D-alanyl-D-alanine ligase, partial [Oscillospiraceae bacterium]|nr:UDP-N-acetylmuramoyl-tripeptide--D-alanyl-D-alanine ligase [Oscillospiraceae bacterium]